MRYKAAAERIFEELCKFKGKTQTWFSQQWPGLEKDISECFGKQDQNQRHKQERIEKYRKILGADDKYNEKSWFQQAVRLSFPANHTFKANYQTSHWYLFQKDIITHQKETYKILEPLFKGTGQKNSWA